jgi:hypothetical protein
MGSTIEHVAWLLLSTVLLVVGCSSCGLTGDIIIFNLLLIVELSFFDWIPKMLFKLFMLIQTSF